MASPTYIASKEGQDAALTESVWNHARNAALRLLHRTWYRSLLASITLLAGVGGAYWSVADNHSPLATALASVVAAPLAGMLSHVFTMVACIAHAPYAQRDAARREVARVASRAAWELGQLTERLQAASNTDALLRELTTFVVQANEIDEQWRRKQRGLAVTGGEPATRDWTLSVRTFLQAEAPQYLAAFEALGQLPDPEPFHSPWPAELHRRVENLRDIAAEIRTQHAR